MQMMARRRKTGRVTNRNFEAFDPRHQAVTYTKYTQTVDNRQRLLENLNWHLRQVT